MIIPTEVPSAPYFAAYGVGLVYASVCTNLPDELAVRRLNLEHWTGVGPWAISADATFADGAPHPAPCPDRADCRHLLVEC